MSGRSWIAISVRVPIKFPNLQNKMATTIEALLEAFAENNDAVAHLTMHQETDVAVRLLTKVLRSCQDNIAQLNACDERLNNVSNKVVLQLLDRCIRAPPASTQPTEEVGSNLLLSPPTTCRRFVSRQKEGGKRGCAVQPCHRNLHSSEPDLGQYIFEQLIVVPPSFGSSFIEIFGIANICMFLSCAATFNLALLYQMTAQDALYSESETLASWEEKCAQSMIPLRKAARLYEICITLQEEDEEEFEESCPDPSLFDLVTANNLGVALGMLGQDAKSTECFKYALSALMYLNDKNSRAPTGESPLKLPSGDDMDGFFRNAYSVLQHAEVAPAA